MQNTTQPLKTLTLIRSSQSSREELMHQFIGECCEAKIPVIKVFLPTETEMFLDVQLAFLFTERKDWQYFYWYCSPRIGFCVADTRIIQGQNWVSFEEWDPKADLYVYQHWGATGMRPEEWVKRRLNGETDACC